MVRVVPPYYLGLGCTRKELCSTPFGLSAANGQGPGRVQTISLPGMKRRWEGENTWAQPGLCTPHCLDASVGSTVRPLCPGKPRRSVLAKAAAHISFPNSLVVQVGSLMTQTDRACPVQVASMPVPEAFLLAFYAGTDPP